jgi:hypothetical protein
MDLRAELLPRTGSVKDLASQIERAFDLSDREGAAAAAAWFASETGITVAADDLHGWSASLDSHQVARLLLRPPQHELRRLGASREELIEIARRWLPTSAAYDGKNEDWWLALFDANVPRPDGSNAAFYPPEGVKDSDVTPEWVVDHAFAYRAIEL